MKPIGTVTRGTTNPNRLRRVDRYLAGPCAGALRAVEAPVVVDLGYGRVPTTALELYDRLVRVNPQVRVLGIEIEPERVAAAKPYEHANVHFLRGGFEIPLPPGWAAPSLIRSMNVLRQYDEADVPAAWQRVCNALTPEGLFVEGTCDELGRLCTWVTLAKDGPREFTIALKLDDVELPSKVAERLPKALIHHNVPGEPIYAVLQQLDKAWLTAAPHSVFGAKQRWLKTIEELREHGVPVLHTAARWKLGEVTLPWDYVATR